MIVIGIDPGTHNLGLGVLYVDNDLNVTKAVPMAFNADSIIASGLINDSDDIYLRHDLLLDLIDKTILSLDDEVVAIAYEIPHFDRNKPASYATLMHHIYLLKKHLEKTHRVPVTGYRPTAIKACIGANKKQKGENSKQVVLRCMKENKELVDNIKFDIELYTDDALDSILIAYKHVTLAREAP